MSLEDKLQILQMIESKQITPEEGLNLLAALEQTKYDSESYEEYHSARFLRVKVVEGNRTKVDVNLPISLIEAFLGFGTKFIPQDVLQVEQIDFNSILAQIKAGASGKIVQFEDGNSFVEVSII